MHRRHVASGVLLAALAAGTATAQLSSYSTQESFADLPPTARGETLPPAPKLAFRLEAEIPKLQFYDAPQLKDLYENRQYALERSRYDSPTARRGGRGRCRRRDLACPARRGIGAAFRGTVGPRDRDRPLG